MGKVKPQHRVQLVVAGSCAAELIERLVVLLFAQMCASSCTTIMRRNSSGTCLNIAAIRFHVWAVSRLPLHARDGLVCRLQRMAHHVDLAVETTLFTASALRKWRFLRSVVYW